MRTNALTMDQLCLSSLVLVLPPAEFQFHNLPALPILVLFVVGKVRQLRFFSGHMLKKEHMCTGKDFKAFVIVFFMTVVGLSFAQFLHVSYRATKLYEEGRPLGFSRDPAIFLNIMRPINKINDVAWCVDVKSQCSHLSSELQHLETTILQTHWAAGALEKSAVSISIIYTIFQGFLTIEQTYSGMKCGHKKRNKGDICQLMKVGRRNGGKKSNSFRVLSRGLFLNHDLCNRGISKVIFCWKKDLEHHHEKKDYEIVPTMWGWTMQKERNFTNSTQLLKQRKGRRLFHHSIWE